MERTSITTTAVELLILVALGFLTIHTYSKAIYSNEQDAFWSWASDINKTPVKKGERVAAIQAEKIAYYTGWDTIYLPANIPSLKDTSNYGDNQQAWRNYRAWLKHWKPSYLIVRLFDFSNPLAEYPHASVSTILDSSLDPVVLLKINLDESALTEEDAAHDAKMRDLWKQHIHARIPAREGVFANILNYVKGVSPPCGCFFVPNTPENQAKFSTGRVVLLPNGEQRVIRESYFNDWRLFVKVHGGAFTNSFPDLPDTLETIDGDPIPAFFITNDQWVRGVARQWAGFYVEDNPQNQQKYKAGYTVELPTKEERTITKTVNEPGVIKIYLSGNPLDGYKTGTPDYFKVRSK